MTEKTKKKSGKWWATPATYPILFLFAIFWGLAMGFSGVDDIGLVLLLIGVGAIITCYGWHRLGEELEE